MRTQERNVTILAPEAESQLAFSMLPTEPAFRLVPEPSNRNLRTAKNLFVSVSATGLSEVAEVVKRANDTKLLRVLFVREDVPAEWLPQMCWLADLRMARNIFVHSSTDWDTPRRIVRAWHNGSQNDLIARASVTGNTLLVMNCALDAFEIQFDDIPALKKISKNQRSNFNISKSGSYIHWDDGDVHLDIDAIRYATDEKWRNKCDLEKLTHNKNFGKAIAAVRRKHNLDKTDIAGISDRQLRRIENEGARPSIETLSVLAKAHKLALNSYLQEIANHF